jgi:hypothetical protein
MVIIDKNKAQRVLTSMSLGCLLGGWISDDGGKQDIIIGYRWIYTKPNLNECVKLA